MAAILSLGAANQQAGDCLLAWCDSLRPSETGDDMRITSGTSGLDLASQRSLLSASNAAMTSMLRLATLRQIKSGADDAAGLIAVTALQSELSSLTAASSNTQQAASVLSTVDSGLSQVDSLLDTIRGNIVASAGNTLTDEELAANQTEIDAAVKAIDLISDTTTYGSRKVLDGTPLEFSFSTDGQSTVALDLPEVASGTLGGSDGTLTDLTSGGIASLTSGDTATAISILDDASRQISDSRTRVGALERYAVNTSADILSTMQASVASAVSQIFDTDMAVETSLWIRAQILTQSSLSTSSIVSQRQSLIGNLLNQTASG